MAIGANDTAVLDAVFAAAEAWRGSPAGVLVDLGKLTALAKPDAVAGDTVLLGDMFLSAVNEIEAVGAQDRAIACSVNDRMSRDYAE